MQYPAATLSFQKGKYYAVVTIPEPLREHFKGLKQLKRSTGTSDKKLAEQALHSKASEIYRLLGDANQTTSPIYVALNNYIEAIGTSGIINLSTKNLADPLIIEDILFQLRRDASESKRGDGSDDARFHAEVRIEALEDAINSLNSPKLAQIEKSKEKKFSEAAAEYLVSNSWRREKTKAAAQKAWSEFIEIMGDLPVSGITKPVGYKYAKKLAETLANKTIKSRISYVSQVLTFNEKEGLIDINPLKGLELNRYGKKTEHYRSFTTDQLHELFKQDLPKDVRLLLSVLVTTGMRLDEAALLSSDDIKNDGVIPFFDLTASDKVIKNDGSARQVPIIPQVFNELGAATGRLFPRFKVDADGKAQSAASKACITFIRKFTSDPNIVVHSLRGTLKDKLRDAGVQKEINDFITGHGSGDVAGKYGSGPSLKVRYEALCKVDHPWLERKAP
jgi:integrase